MILKRDFYLTNLFILFVLFGLGCSLANKTQDLSMPKDQPPSSFKPSVVEEWTLVNGVKVLFLPDVELPIVKGTLFVPKGTLWANDTWESLDSSSIISVMGQQLRQGGAGKYNADQLDLELEKLSAHVDSSFGTEYGTVGFSGLSSDFEKVFELFKLVLLEPRFQQDRLDLWKGQALESIRRRTDDPSTIAGIAFKKLLFGETVLGRITTSSSVKEIQRDHLLKAYQQFVHPENALLVITGNISKERLNKTLTQQLANWNSKNREQLNLAKIDHVITPGIYFIKQPFQQSTVYMGQIGPARLTPDYVAIEAFNLIFGGGDFGSRLMKKIRTEQGLAYSVFGSIIAGFPVGQNVVVIQTKSESTAQAIHSSLDIIQNMQSVPVDLSELDQAKKSVQSSFIFKFATPEEVIRREALLRLLSYPADYDKTYVSKVEALIEKDVHAVAKKYWDLSKFVIVVVGNEKAYNSLAQQLKENVQGFAGLKLKECSFLESLGECH
jgi:zinc protease